MGTLGERGGSTTHRGGVWARKMLPQSVLYTEILQSELLLRGLPWKATPPEVALFLLGVGFQVNEGDIQLCQSRGLPKGRAVVRAKNDRRRHQSAIRRPRAGRGPQVYRGIHAKQLRPHMVLGADL